MAKHTAERAKAAKKYKQLDAGIRMQADLVLSAYEKENGPVDANATCASSDLEAEMIRLKGWLVLCAPAMRPSMRRRRDLH